MGSLLSLLECFVFIKLATSRTKNDHAIELFHAIRGAHLDEFLQESKLILDSKCKGDGFSSRLTFPIDYRVQ